jgi:hypothetical protein
MRSLNGRAVVQGNSGGGIFSAGQLVGTMCPDLSTTKPDPVSSLADGPKKKSMVMMRNE